MDSKEEIRKELSELAPRLEKVEKKNPFRVPDYYFQALPDKIMERVKGMPLPWADRLELWLNEAFSTVFRPRYAIPVSAFLLSLAAGVSFFKSKTDVHADAMPMLSQVPSDELQQFLIENADEGDLIALGTPARQRSGFIPDEVSRKELEDYINNNSDNQTIEEEIL